MGLERLTDRVCYFPHQAEVDRPMLAYLRGDHFSLAIDAGYSAKHVDDFYRLLDEAGLKRPDFTVITHWHYDHTFGMFHIHGASIACQETNRFLKQQQAKACDAAYIDVLKNSDPYFAREYIQETTLKIVQADLQFQGQLVLDLGGITAQIFHTEAPHSEDSVCVYVPEEKILFLGDSVCEDVFHNGYMDKEKLRKLMDMIEQKDCAYCLLSHDEPLQKNALLEDLYGVLHGTV